jgi:hypothetical protein
MKEKYSQKIRPLDSVDVCTMYLLLGNAAALLVPQYLVGTYRTNQTDQEDKREGLESREGRIGEEWIRGGGFERENLTRLFLV